jgi:hypothetical protein
MCAKLQLSFGTAKFSGKYPRRKEVGSKEVGSK